MALNSTTNADELTAEQVNTMLVTPLQSKSVFLSAGPTIVDTAGPLRMPMSMGATTPAWYAQNAQIAESDPSFNELSLLPSTMQSVKVLTRFSNELARQSVVSLEEALRQRLVKDVADAIDAQLLSATGDGVTKPKGLFAYSGVQNVPTVGALTLDSLMTAEGLALAADVDLGSLVWVMKPREFTKLRKLKDTSGRYQMTPDPTVAGGFILLGHKVVLSNYIPDVSTTTSAALVDFSQIVVARDVAPSVKLLDQTFGDFDQQAVRVVARYDAAPANPAAVVTLTGITI